jgi:benzoylformate decarboxylase
VLRNGGYGALQNFLAQLGVDKAPGLDLPGMDAVAIAGGYGMAASRATTEAEVAAVLAGTAAPASPRLVEVSIAPEIRPLG